ncbi:hypothetical protein [Pseudaquidulcibacter saccharophilus]|uniref:hypothetical protein n=1 Tax=Pseudaquidulcibacter saccharophilus TaxID=2831900 RepID=UPI001EFF12DD|nr:hypothetical protein [Pseudaquidulcibacter saccharophilus]
MDDNQNLGILSEVRNAIGVEQLDPNMLSRANINPKTGFATDYLNVFNEAVMLFGLLGDMPEIIEELEIWEFLDYKEHFRRSSFQAKDLAIAVYDLIAEDVRATFDNNSRELGEMIKNAITEAKDLIARGENLTDFSQYTCFELQSCILILDGMIHGNDNANTNAQNNVDALFD